MKKNDNNKLELLKAFPQLLGESMLNPQVVYKSLNYEIKLLNTDGDAKIHTEGEIINVSLRELTEIKLMAAATSEMTWSDMNFKTFSKPKRELQASPVSDRPNQKQISIQFLEPVGFLKSTSFSYEYTWDEMFPEKKEFFFNSIFRPCWKLGFKLSYPKDLKLRHFDVIKYSRFFGDEEILTTELKGDYNWDKRKRVIQVQLVPDIFCQYRYLWSVM